MIRKAIGYTFTGIGIGAVISTACMWLMGRTESTLIETTGWLAASAAYGLLSMIMDWKRPAFWMRLLIHGSLCWAVTLITSWLLYRAKIGVLVRETLPIFGIVYAGVWFIIILWERRTVKQLNKRLSQE
ncbi:MAG: DUF3021 family protein [Lachnospiraceae bacterium]|jgi:formate-dependent nitrite reductase membrane component NrfD